MFTYRAVVCSSVGTMWSTNVAVKFLCWMVLLTLVLFYSPVLLAGYTVFLYCLFVWCTIVALLSLDAMGNI